MNSTTHTAAGTDNLPALSKAPRIHFPTEEEKKAVIDEFIASQRVMRKERRAAVDVAALALPRLCEVMHVRTGQSYKVRALLYSLWNGKPASASELMNLDWDIRKDVCA